MQTDWQQISQEIRTRELIHRQKHRPTEMEQLAQQAVEQLEMSEGSGKSFASFLKTAPKPRV